MWVFVGRIALGVAACAASVSLLGGSLAPAHYEAKLATARFYFERVMPQTLSLHAAITAGAESVLAMPLESF